MIGFGEATGVARHPDRRDKCLYVKQIKGLGLETEG